MSSIIIKSISNGIKVNLPQDISFEDILSETGRKFTESKGFFKGGQLAVSFSGRALSEEEENSLIRVMEDNGEFSVTYMIAPDENNEGSIARNLGKALDDRDTTGFGTVYKGSIYKDEHIQFESGVVVLGDVEPGGLVRAKGNVIILGGLYGSVNIEVTDEKPGFIFASEMSPERIKIGNERYYHEKPKWSIKPKYQTKVAYIKDGKIVVEAISRNVLKDFASNV